MKEITVQVPIGHEGIGLITPADKCLGDTWTRRCIYPKAISLITEQSLREEKVYKPMTAKQRKKIRNGQRFRTYMVYNLSPDSIVLPKN